MNPKTELNDLLQSTGKPVVKYRSERTGGEDHIPFYHSTVKIDGNVISGDIVIGKRAAEMNVAKKALVFLKTPNTSPFEGEDRIEQGKKNCNSKQKTETNLYQTSTSECSGSLNQTTPITDLYFSPKDPDTILFIDLANVRNPEEMVFGKNTHVIGVKANCVCKIVNLDNCKKIMEVSTTDSNDPNALSILLTFYMTEMFTRGELKGKNVVILSERREVFKSLKDVILEKSFTKIKIVDEIEHVYF